MSTEFQKLALDRPLLCQCGSRSFRYAFQSFPMHFSATCTSCETTIECNLKTSKPPVIKSVPPDYSGWGGYGMWG